jgi:hypothetical protein
MNVTRREMDKDLLKIVIKLRDVFDDIINQDKIDEMLETYILDALSEVSLATKTYLLHHGEIYRIKDFKKFKKPDDIMNVKGISHKRCFEILEELKKGGYYQLIWK